MNVKRKVMNLPGIREWNQARIRARQTRALGATMLHPPGHFYSPIPSLTEVRRREGEIFQYPETLPGIDVRTEHQLALIADFAAFHHDQPFGATERPGLRYRYANGYFSWADGIILHCMLRQLRPKRLIEVGSGFTSALILDTNDLFLDSSLSCTFIEPFPARLRHLLRESDGERHNIISEPVQRVPLTVFDDLEAGDVLFIDSTHVSKVGSDVNRLVFEVLPRLRPGVVVHFHDIGWPFEYPKEWIYRGKAFNEAYLLRAFLMFNDTFEIELFNHYLAVFHAATTSAALPVWAEDMGGSLWLRHR